MSPRPNPLFTRKHTLTRTEGVLCPTLPVGNYQCSSGPAGRTAGQSETDRDRQTNKENESETDREKEISVISGCRGSVMSCQNKNT